MGRGSVQIEGDLLPGQRRGEGACDVAIGTDRKYKLVLL